MTPQVLGGIDGVMVGHGDDGHAQVLEPVIDFRGVVVGFPAHAAQAGSVAHSRGGRVNVKVAAHETIVTARYEQSVKRSRNLRECALGTY